MRPIKQRVSPKKWRDPYLWMYRNEWVTNELELRRFLDEAAEPLRAFTLKGILMAGRAVRTFPVLSDLWRTT